VVLVVVRAAPLLVLVTSDVTDVATETVLLADVDIMVVMLSVVNVRVVSVVPDNVVNVVVEAVAVAVGVLLRSRVAVALMVLDWEVWLVVLD
jgi:hypothetical protein